jgi:hypothetical protein
LPLRNTIAGVAAAAVLTCLVLGACADTFRGLGPTPAVAESHADELFESIATRFDRNELDPRYEQARLRLVQAALVPSRVFSDSAVWSLMPSATTRMLLVHGSMDDKAGHYRLETRSSLTPITRGGDTRHTMELRSLEPDVYRWDTNVDLGVGSISAAEVSNMTVALFRVAEGRTDGQLREDYRAAFPRTSAAFGRGFAIDSMHLAPAPGGGTSVSITAGFHPEAMRESYPALTKYLEKYLGPAKYHFVLADRDGTPLLDALGHDRFVTFRYRVAEGRLAPLYGPLKPWSDTLRLTTDIKMKVKLFNVGFHQLVTDFVISDVGHERAISIIARREPEWNLPLVTERLIRTPLHRPFIGQGSLFQLSVRDTAGGQTVFARRTRFDVQESTIARFLGSLAGRMMSDLDMTVEAEENRFLRDGFVAMQADLKTAARGWHARESQ